MSSVQVQDKLADGHGNGAPAVVQSQQAKAGPSGYGGHFPAGQGQQKGNKNKKKGKKSKNKMQGGGPGPGQRNNGNNYRSNYKDRDNPEWQPKKGNWQGNKNFANEQQHSWKKGGERTRKKRMLAQRNDRVPMRPILKICTRFIRGKCSSTNNTNSEGDPCTLAHLVRRRTSRKCKFWIMNSCLMGEKCAFSHVVPCKYYFLSNRYHDQGKCRFSHDPLTETSRELLIEDLALDLAPKVIHHDFKEPHGKQIKTDAVSFKQNPISQLQMPTTTPSNPSAPSVAKPNDSTSLDAATSTPTNETLQQFSFSGFYKDTLDSPGPSSPHSEPEAELMIADEQIESQNVEASTEEPEELTDIINGVSKTPIDWNAIRIQAERGVNYNDIRSTVLQGHTLIDPRLSFAPIRRKLKSLEALGPNRGDFLETEYQNHDAENLQQQFLLGGSMSISEMFTSGLLSGSGPSAGTSVSTGAERNHSNDHETDKCSPSQSGTESE